MAFTKPIAAAAALVAGAALAHSGATGIVKERMETMKAISNATKALGAIKSGVIPFSIGTIKRAAEDIAAHTAEAAAQFPEGSNAAPSEALPAIWAERGRFDDLMRDLELAAARLAATADDDAATIALIDEIGGYCKDCHATFRKP